MLLNTARRTFIASFSILLLAIICGPASHAMSCAGLVTPTESASDTASGPYDEKIEAALEKVRLNIPEFDTNFEIIRSIDEGLQKISIINKRTQSFISFLKYRVSHQQVWKNSGFVDGPKTLYIEMEKTVTGITQNGLSTLLLGLALKDNPGIVRIQGDLHEDNFRIYLRHSGGGSYENKMRGITFTPAYKMRTYYGFTKFDIQNGKPDFDLQSFALSK